MKIYARKKMKGHIVATCLRTALPAIVFILFLSVFVPGVLCIIYGTDTVSEYVGLELSVGNAVRVLVPAALLSVSFVLLIFVFAFAFYSEAWIFYCLDKNQTRPKSLLKPSQAFRYVSCRIRTAVLRILWGSLYFSPSAAIFAAVYSGAVKGINRTVFVVLTVCGALLFVAGVLFYSVTSSRYYLTDYLLYLNPMIPPKEAVVSSVKLTDGKLLEITLKRLSLVPWAFAELLILPLPFATVYRRFCAAALKERVYGEDKRKKSGAAVVFYINRNSRIAGV